MWRVLGVQVPSPERVSVLNVDLTDIEPLERRADSVLKVEFLVEGSAGSYIVLIESQTERDDERRRRWPYYIAHLHDKYRCPVVLVVVSSKASTAKWAREPIRIGLPDLISMAVFPAALGPDNVPPVTDVAEASRDVPYAVFSACANSRGPQLHGILEALAAALDTIDTETATVLAEFTEAGLDGTTGQQIWRALMAIKTFPYVSELRSQGREEGRQEGLQEGRQEGLQEGRQAGRQAGQAEAILRILDKRGIAVADASRQRIEACSDMDTLGTWLDRSLTATDVSELFA